MLENIKYKASILWSRGTKLEGEAIKLLLQSKFDCTVYVDVKQFMESLPLVEVAICRGEQVVLTNSSCILVRVLDSLPLKQCHGAVMVQDGVEEIVFAINETARKGSYLSPALRQMVLLTGSVRSLAANPSIISEREKEVLGYISAGRTTKEIAQLLNISYRTVDKHRTNIRRKLDIHSSAALVRYGITNNLIPIGQ